MTRTTRNSKRAKISVCKPRGKKHNGVSGSMVVLAPIRTRRGKITYTEGDATPYYASSDEGGESSKRKPSETPSCSKTAAPASEDAFQWEGYCLNDQEPHVPRIIKVRLRL